MTACMSVLMCHAPITLPAIAGPRAGECATTTRAMGDAARALVAAAPDVVCIVSPHAPRQPDSVGIATDGSVAGSFARFGHPELGLHVPGSPAFAARLGAACHELGLAHHALPGGELDHGALVPLHFLVEAGLRAPVVVLGLPYPDPARERALGEAIARAAEASRLRVAVLASGDMSHRLRPGAPSGYDARAQGFDDAFVAALGQADVPAALSLSPALSELAAEDVVASTRVAFAATRGEARRMRVLAYEAPFGVGYCEAVLCDAEPPGARVPLLSIARRAVEAAVRGEDYRPPASDTPPRAVFVTLRGPDGSLRGCIGRTAPALDHLTDEIADCAALAATRDPRMAPISAAEVDGLHIDVTLLDPPEWDVSEAELDPRCYGVVVRHGGRQGVLLPALEGVHSADEQLAIALRKAGIGRREPYRIGRFTVQKLSE